MHNDHIQRLWKQETCQHLASHSEWRSLLHLHAAGQFAQWTEESCWVNGVNISYTVPVGQGKARSIESAEAAALAVLRANDFPPALGAKVSFLRESWALAGYPNALRPTGAALLAMRAWELALQAASQAHGAPVSLHLEMGVPQATATPVY